MGYARRLHWFVSQLDQHVLQLQIITFFELFSGLRAWSRGMELLEYQGVSADRLYSCIESNLMNCDFLTPLGFLNVVAGVMRLHRYAVFLGAIPCASWVFFSRWTTGRHIYWAGHDDNRWVLAQNALVSRMVYILILCIKRGVYSPSPLPQVSLRLRRDMELLIWAGPWTTH